MSAPGLYKCDVMDTATFQDNGLIQVRVHSIDPLDVTENAEVMTPFGGLPNMGLQALPPIGSVGYVLFQQQNDNYPIFVGSLLVGGENTDGIKQHSVEAEAVEDFVIKTQHTTFDDREQTSDENKVENIIRMNKTELLLAKVNQTGDYTYETEGYDIADKVYNTIKLSDEDITINFKFGDNSKSNSISVKEDSVDMTFDTDAGEMNINVSEDKVSLIAGSAKVSIEKDGKVKIDAEEINLVGNKKTAALYEGFRDFVNQGFNSHTHGSPAGPTSPPVKPFTSTNSAKSKKVKLS